MKPVLQAAVIVGAATLGTALIVAGVALSLASFGPFLGSVVALGSFVVLLFFVTWWYLRRDA